jgi:energy-coupling factor transporter ATPase
VTESIIKIEDLSYRYPRTKKWVLKDINLEVKKGEFLAVMGENGAGKTTFCQCINGVIPHSHQGKLKGSVTVEGIKTVEATVSYLAQYVGMVLEDPETQLFTTRIRDEVAFGPENLRMSVEEILERVKWALKVVRLEHYEDRQPTALSGGQKQRLAIAAAIAMKPKILVLDEPTSQLDPIGTEEVFSVIRELKDDYGMTVVIATHKSEEIAKFADKVLILKGGQIQALDIPQVIFSNTELLKDNWVRPPQVSELATYLAEKGDPLSSFPILPEECINLLVQWYKEAKA